MPTLGSHLNFAQLEARNPVVHNLATAPAAPIRGQMYYDTVSNTLLWWDGTAWQSAKSIAATDATASVKGVVQLAGDLTGTAAAPTVATGAITSAKIADGTITDTDVAAANKDGVAGTASMRTLGTGATQAAPGNDARFGSGGPPTGAAGGDLAGSTYPNPVVATGAITSAKIADGTITDTDVAAANKDGSSVVPSLRTLGLGVGQAMAGQTRIDSLASTNGLNTPLTIGTQRIINLADPTGAQDGATKNYVDNSVQGLDAKASVRAASTADLGMSGATTVDGVALIVGDRVLVKDQGLTKNNGIYIVASGAWTRATDMDAWTEFPGAFTWVEQGTTQADTGWVCTVDQGGTLGTTSVTWTQFTGAAQITAGAGITKAGNTLSANVDNASIDAAGAGSSLEVKAGGITGAMLAAGSVSLSSGTVTGGLGIANGGTGAPSASAARGSLGAAGYYNNSATHGAGTTIAITQATHGLRATRAIHVQVQDSTTGNVELPDVTVAANGDVTITYAASVGANTKLISLVG